jgi:Flp pilus assembly CpaE family ATPase
MPIYFLSTNLNPQQGAEFESKIKVAIPDLIRIAKLDEIASDLRGQSKEPAYIVVVGPADNDAYLERFISIATQYHDRFYFILVSEDISTQNYKRLVRTGSADWVSMAGAPQEIIEIAAKRRKDSDEIRHSDREQRGPCTVACLPSAGGVGNTTLLAEIGVGLKLQKATKERRICIIDLDFQTSHICDYLDLEPRLQIQEISENPRRLDAHLFGQFVSHHSSGLDIFAAPRSKFDIATLDIKALDALFEIIAKRYDLILIDLPVTWYSWTASIIGHSNAVIVTGLNTIPSLRQLCETLAAVRDARPNSSAESVVVAINRCERTLLGGVDRRQHVESVLGHEKVFYVGNDPAGVVESTNTGTPMVQAGGSRKTVKEIQAIAAFCANASSEEVKSAGVAELVA